MKLNIVKDEMYPVFYLYETIDKTSSYEHTVDVSEELYEQYSEVLRKFYEVQNELDDLWERNIRENSASRY